MKTKGKKPAPKKVAPVVNVGAVSALRRLETEEARLFGLTKKAESSGDAFESKAARDAWLKVSESLRRFDLIVAQSKREIGEMVARKDVEAWLRNAAGWLHFSLIPAVGNSPEQAFESAARTFEGYIASAGHGAPVPLWIARALFSHFAWLDRDTALLRWRRAHHTQTALELYPNDFKKIAAHVETAIAKDTAELKA